MPLIGTGTDVRMCIYVTSPFVTGCLFCDSLHIPKSGIVSLKCDGTCTETRFRLSPKRTSPFKSAGASVQTTAGSRGVHISGSNAG